jgi:DNA replication and repair protein RecF
VRYATAEGVEAGMTADEIMQPLHDAIGRRALEERRRGVTLVGPHRDDLSFYINALAAEKYASQGEQKTLLVALKLSEYDFVTARCGETPILLLDDVFAELDRHRATRVMQRLRGGGQCIITATDESLIGDAMQWNSEHRRIIVESGTCREASA